MAKIYPPVFVTMSIDLSGLATALEKVGAEVTKTALAFEAFEPFAPFAPIGETTKPVIPTRRIDLDE